MASPSDQPGAVPLPKMELPGAHPMQGRGELVRLGVDVRTRLAEQLDHLRVVVLRRQV